MKQDSGYCPTCGVTISRPTLIHDGILHGQEAVNGGPFYTLLCPGCGWPLVARAHEGSAIVFLRDVDLSPGSRMRDALRFFRGTPRRPRRPAQDDRPSGQQGVRRAPRLPVSLAVARALKTLGLESHAGLSDVKQRFRELAKLHHPDLHASADAALRRAAEERFIEVSRAYQEILDRWEG